METAIMWHLGDVPDEAIVETRTIEGISESRCCVVSTNKKASYIFGIVDIRCYVHEIRCGRNM